MRQGVQFHLFEMVSKSCWLGVVLTPSSLTKGYDPVHIPCEEKVCVLDRNLG